MFRVLGAFWRTPSISRVARPVLILPRSLSTTLVLRDWQSELKQLRKVDNSENNNLKISEHPPSRQIFVANIPYDGTEQDVYELFNQFGVIHAVRLVKNYDGSSRGFGYVTFAEQKAATAAISTDLYALENLLHADYVDPRPNQIRMSRPPNRRLYVGNLPRSTSEVDIREQFESFGPVTSIRLCKRGDFAHVEFRREEDAIVAHERFAEQPLHLHEHLIHIAYDTFTNSSNKAPDRRIFVSNIPVEATERDLHETFAQFGAINSMRLIVEPDESTRRFAYLTFAEQASATAAFDTLLFLFNRHLRVDYAPRTNSDRLPNRCLSVGNLPIGTSEVDIREPFGYFGPIGIIRLSSDGDFAQVEFLREEDAIAAYEGFLEKPLYIYDNKIRINYTSPLASEMPAVDPGIGTSHYLSADNLPAGTSETDIRVQFAFFGPITSVRLNSDGRSAQVEFMSEKDAAAAYESFSTDPLYIEDHKIHIKYYSPSSPSGQYNFHPPSRRVFVANMPLETTVQDIHETFAQFGVIRSVHLIDNSGGLRSRPFGWVTFAKREAAAAAVGANLRLFHHLLRVDYAAPLHQGNIRAVAPPSSHLFVGGLSLATSEAEVREQFEYFGSLRSIRLRKGADFAHVEFMKQEHAVAAYETFLHEPLYVHGRKIRMNYAPERPANPVLPNNRVYFWDFHGDRTALSLLLKGLNPTIKKIHFLRDYGNSRSGIVTFVSVETAAQAIKRLNGLSTPHGPLNLEYAKL